MRPYLAVLKDSFREAMASRALWILLLLTTVFLAAMAPLGYRETVTIGLNEGAVREWPELIERIRDEGQAPDPSPSRRIWTLLDAATQERMEKFAMPEEGDVTGAFELIKTMKEVPKALDRLLQRTDFYEEEAFEETPLVADEARELKRKLPDLSDDEMRRFNRLLLEAAYPDLVRVSPRTSVVFTYLVWDAGTPMPLGARGFTRRLESQVIFVMRWFIGAFGVLLAILITAPIIPRTLEPGSLNLLLSKPISRWLLFLTKYAGACAFILIASAYLIGGVWLLLGLRFGVWRFALLLCIPVYVFVFAVYYSVSSLAGVLWRSTIAAILFTFLFWLLCFLVGTAKMGVESSLLNKTRIIKLVQAKETLISTNEMGLSSRWDDKESEWKEIFVSDDQRQLRPMMYVIPLEGLPPTIGPVSAREGDELWAVRRSLKTRKLAFSVGKREGQWECVTGAAAPPGTFSLLHEPDDDVLAVSALGLFRIEGDPLAAPEPLRVFGVDVPFTGGDPSRSVGPQPPLILRHPASAALNADTGRLAVYSRGVVTLLEEDEEGEYQRLRERKLGGESEQSAALAMGGATLLVARADGRLLVLRADDLRERRRFRPEPNSSPRFVAASPGGRWFAVVFHNRRLWLLDAETDTLRTAPVEGQGDISAAAFSGPDQLLVADRSTRVTRYEAPTGRIQQRCSPPLGLVEWTYRRGILPMYTVFPKPGELDTTIEHLLSERTDRARGGSRDVSAPRKTARPWAPVWSSLAFALIVLAAACVCMERREA